MEPDENVTLAIAWARYTGNYHAREFLERWQRMSPRQRAEAIVKMKRAGKVRETGDENN